MNATFGPFGVTLVAVETRERADFRVRIASSSACGGFSDGVLGCATGAGEVTLMSGWDWYGESSAILIGANQYDFQTVVTHEIGHTLGLGHSADPDSVMYWSLAPGVVRRGLTAADLANLDADGDGDEALHSGPEALYVRPRSTVHDSLGDQGLQDPVGGAAWSVRGNHLPDPGRRSLDQLSARDLILREWRWPSDRAQVIKQPRRASPSLIDGGSQPSVFVPTTQSGGGSRRDIFADDRERDGFFAELDGGDATDPLENPANGELIKLLFDAP